MNVVRLLAPLGVAAAVFAVATAGASATSHAATKPIECQHPLVTGEEALGLVRVTKTTACGLVIDLGHWEAKRGNRAKLYTCAGKTKHTPVLKLDTFNGWNLSLTKKGYFEMSLKGASFEIIGTDFPLNCT